MATIAQRLLQVAKTFIRQCDRGAAVAAIPALAGSQVDKVVNDFLVAARTLVKDTEFHDCYLAGGNRIMQNCQNKINREF